MKGILCLKCLDFKALDPGPENIVRCRCFNVAASWTNPEKGWMKIFAVDRDKARVIGIHNAVFGAARDIQPDHDYDWREFQAETSARADGYLFHTSRRDSLFVIVRVGESNDVAWWEDYKDDRG